MKMHFVAIEHAAAVLADFLRFTRGRELPWCSASHPDVGWTSADNNTPYAPGVDGVEVAAEAFALETEADEAAEAILARGKQTLEAAAGNSTCTVKVTRGGKVHVTLTGMRGSIRDVWGDMRWRLGEPKWTETSTPFLRPWETLRDGITRLAYPAAKAAVGCEDEEKAAAALGAALIRAADEARLRRLVDTGGDAGDAEAAARPFNEGAA